MPVNATVARIEATLPRLVKDTLQRGGFQLQAFVERFILDQGPATYPSNSPRWGPQSGRATRSLIPGQPENIFKLEESGGRWSLTYGSKVEYVAYLESGTRFMKARPALKPGIEAFGKEQWPKLLEGLMKAIAQEFNR